MAIELLAGERKENETDKAVIASNDYLLMGPLRSLEKLFHYYTTTTPEAAPTKSVRWLKEWSSLFGWVERAQTYDASNQAAKSAEVQRLRTEGLAADFERIKELDAIYQALRNEFREGTGLWYWDIKMSAKGDTVDVKVFNKPLIDSMRGVLDDLAKETGGRKTKTENINIDMDKLTSDQLERIAAGEDAYQVIVSGYISTVQS